MTENDARTWMTTKFGAEAVARVETFLTMVVAENEQQNLIAPSTIDTIWMRHAVDSAQLIDLAPSDGVWIDVGTGGGFPGMIVALLRDAPITMVEPRGRRVAFLEHCVEALGLRDQATVVGTKVQHIATPAAIISARAVASVEKLLQASAHCATPGTRWVLPRGRMTQAELAALKRCRGKMFHVEHSLTDPDSIILVIEERK